MNRISLLLLVLILGLGKVEAQVLESPAKQLVMKFGINEKGAPPTKSIWQVVL